MAGNRGSKKPLTQAIDAILAAAAEALGRLKSGDPTGGIHDFRVTMKRWRALLRLVERNVGGEARALRRASSSLTRGLGSSRDLQAAHDALEDISRARKGKSPALPLRTLKAMAARLEELRAGEETGALDQPKIQALASSLRQARRHAAGWAINSITVPVIAAEIARSYRRARRRRPDWTTASDAEIHEFRKTIVVLRYQLTLAEVLTPPQSVSLAAAMQKLRSQLGRSNDLVLLRKLLLPRQPLARWRKIAEPLIAAARKRHLNKARRMTQDLFARSPQEFRKALESIPAKAVPAATRTNAPAGSGANTAKASKTSKEKPKAKPKSKAKPESKTKPGTPTPQKSARKSAPRKELPAKKLAARAAPVSGITHNARPQDPLLQDVLLQDALPEKPLKPDSQSGS